MNLYKGERMKFIETNTKTNRDIYFSQEYPKESILFFDIETTGFSASGTKLYLIGCMYYKNDSWQVGMWFNDDGNSEEEMLLAFWDFSKQYRILIHFNGDGFDIPYLCQKLHRYGINRDFSHLTSIDLYKWIRPYKKILNLPNLKLKTIEEFLHIHREDSYSGKDLILVYERYLRTGENDLFHLLFMHNYEDICNMLDVSDIAYYKDLFEGNITNASLLISRDNVKLSFLARLPKKISLTRHQTYLTADGEHAALTLPVKTGELKFFFDDYKDYFYLPLEDTAIHKSVALYMDKNYRQKATRQNCYQKTTGCFLPTYGYPAEKSFGSSYTERGSYMETSQLETADFNLTAYIQTILQWFIR